MPRNPHRIPVTTSPSRAVFEGRAVPGRCYEAQPIMDLWQDLERRIRERGVRVDERLALLCALRAGEGLSERRESLRRAVENAKAQLLREAGGA